MVLSEHHLWQTFRCSVCEYYVVRKNGAYSPDVEFVGAPNHFLSLLPSSADTQCKPSLHIFNGFSVLGPGHRRSVDEQVESPPCLRRIDGLYLWFGLDIEFSPRFLLRERSHGEVIECQLVGVSWWDRVL
jgi:hypothetical protein